jgi:hypothetical protein
MNKDSVSNSVSKALRVAMFILVFLWFIGCMKSMFK